MNHIPNTEVASLAWALFLGCFLGVRHASDADHVATITTIVRAEDGLGAALKTATWWGIGHTVTFLSVGLAIVVAKCEVPTWFETSCELAVAVVLLGFGAAPWLARLRRHQPVAHGATPRRGIRSLIAGLVHGLAGSAAIALLALTTIKTTLGAVIYLVCFGLGTVVGMAALTVCLMAPLQWSVRCRGQLHHAVGWGASLASMGLGLSMVWHVIMVA